MSASVPLDGAAANTAAKAVLIDTIQKLLIEEAVAGERVDGKRRGQIQAEYDWQRDGQRVACKSAQLLWDLTSKCGRPKPASPRSPYWKAGTGRLPLTLTQILEGAVH